MGGKVFASVLAWLTYLAMLWFTLPTLGTWIILFAFVLMLPLAIFMAMLWGGSSLFLSTENKGAQQQEQNNAKQDSEKRKRERLENVLRDLSNEDLIRLKQRLSDGIINDEVIYQRMVGDDGELVDYN